MLRTWRGKRATRRRPLRSGLLTIEALEGRVTPAPLVFSGAGNTNAATQFADFKTAIGGADNGNNPPQASGFRTINWDGVKLDGTDFGGNTTVIIPNKTVGIPINRFQQRGEIFAEVYAVSGDGFVSANPGLAGQINAFSPNNTFAMFNDNQIELHFVRPSGPTTPEVKAAVRGFGAIFLDVDKANTSFIEYFNGTTSLGKFAVPAGPSGEAEFLGVLFDSAQVTDVQLTVGEAALFSLNGELVTAGPADITNDPVNGKDMAATDDFISSEPAILTTVNLTSSQNPSNSGQQVTFTATVTPQGTNGTPTGSVTFLDGTTTLGTSQLVNGSATLQTTNQQLVAACTHHITAVYNGDGFFAPATSKAVSQIVKPIAGYFAVGYAGGTVRVDRPDGTQAVSFQPYGSSYTGSVSVAVGDVNGDGYPDIVTGATVGNPDVRVYSGKDIANNNFNPNGSSLLAQWFPYALQFNVGANVAVGDVNGDCFADVVTGANVGNPDVRVYNGKDIADKTFNPTGSSLLVQFFPYALQFNVGANVAVGDVNNDGYGEVVTGATVGNPDVRVYNGKDIANKAFLPATTSLLAQFFAFGLNFNVGSFVSVGDVNGDGFGDVVAGSSTGNPQVKVYDGKAIAERTFDNSKPDASLLSQYYAFNTGANIGATVAATNFSSDNLADILSGTTSGTARYKLLDPLGVNNQTNPPGLDGIDVTLSGVSGIVYVGA
jgi:hypothetical protein